MVLVSVREDYPAEAVAVLFEVGEIRNYQVYAGHILVRERKSAVHDEHIIAALVDVQVLAYLVQSAERGELHRCVAYLARLSLR